jgi:hypothetical protein
MVTREPEERLRDPEIGADWDAFISAVQRPVAQKNIGRLMDMGRQTNADVEARLGHYTLTLADKQAGAGAARRTFVEAPILPRRRYTDTFAQWTRHCRRRIFAASGLAPSRSRREIGNVHSGRQHDCRWQVERHRHEA